MADPLTEVTSFTFAIGHFYYETAPNQLLTRAGEALITPIVDRLTNTTDVDVLSTGGSAGNRAIDLVDAAMTHTDRIVWAEDVGTLVDGVRGAADGLKVRRLNIGAHGSPGRQSLASGVFASVDQPFDPRLSELRDILAPGAVVTLHGCNVGEGDRGEQLVRGLAELLGVEVRAGVSAQVSFSTGLEGPMIACRPGPEGVTCTRAPHERLLSAGW